MLISFRKRQEPLRLSFKTKPAPTAEPAPLKLSFRKRPPLGNLYQKLVDRGPPVSTPPITSRMCVLVRKDGSYIGDNENGRIYWISGQGRSAGTLSTDSNRATKFTEAQGLAMLAKDYSLTLKFIHK